MGEGFVILNSRPPLGSRFQEGAGGNKSGRLGCPETAQIRRENRRVGLGPIVLETARKLPEVSPKWRVGACLFADRNTLRGEAILSHCSLAAHVPRLLDDLACSGALLRPPTNLHDILVHCSPSLLLASFCLPRTTTALRSTVRPFLWCVARSEEASYPSF